MEQIGDKVEQQRAESARKSQAIRLILDEWSSDAAWRPDCAQCKGPRGGILVEREGTTLSVPCPRRQDLEVCHLARADEADRDRKRREWLVGAGVPRRYWGMSLDEVAAQVRGDVRGYLERLEEHVAHGRGLVITGDLGTGKSAIMGLLAERALEIGHVSVQWAHATEVMTALCDRKPDQATRLWQWETCSLLLVDDFAAAYMHAFPVSQFEAFMERRHGHMLASCVTTNLLARGLEQARDIARMVDRWSQTCFIVEIRGPSRRQPLEGLP